jgi:hypothetical protein
MASISIIGKNRKIRTIQSAGPNSAIDEATGVRSSRSETGRTYLGCLKGVPELMTVKPHR